MSSFLNNFGAGFVLAPTNGVTVGSTVDGITVTGQVIAGGLNHFNVLFGTPGNDYIVGGDYGDVIYSGGGDDVLTGGGNHGYGYTPHDVFVFDRGSGNDVITDFNSSDFIEIAWYLRHGVVPTLSDTNAGAVITLGPHSSITLLGINSSQLVETSTGFVLSQLMVG